jgi:hypothetical protein
MTCIGVMSFGHSITQLKNSAPPLSYGGGETGFNTVGSRSLSER